MTARAIHGHDVLKYLVAMGGSVSRVELGRWTHEAHGADARYYTCSRDGMSLDELLSFLESRGKIVVADGMLSVFAERMCQHGEAESP